MKVKIFCREERYSLYEEMLKKGGFIISDESIITLMEDNYLPNQIIGKRDNDSVVIELKDVIIIETCGRDIIAKTLKGDFKLKETMEQLEKLLKVDGFIRVSQSAIIKRSFIEKISPGLSMKFHLTLKNGIKTDVTRTYYYSFKENIKF